MIEYYPQFEMYIQSQDEANPNQPENENFWFAGTLMRVKEFFKYGKDWRRRARRHNQITSQDTKYTLSSRAKTYSKTVQCLTEFFTRRSLFDCAKTLLKIKGLVLPSPRDRYVAFLSLIQIQRALRRQILSEDELARVSRSLGYVDDPITRVDLFRARSKLLRHLPNVLQDWKQVRVRTHGQALHHAVQQYITEEQIFARLTSKQASTLHQILTRVTQTFLKTAEGRRIKSYKTWAQAIVIETIKQHQQFNHTHLILNSSQQIILSGTARYRLRKSLSQTVPIHSVAN